MKHKKRSVDLHYVKWLVDRHLSRTGLDCGRAEYAPVETELHAVA